MQVCCKKATGKTSLLNSYVHGKFNHKYQITVGVDFASKIVKVFDHENRETFVQLQIWDTCGQDVFMSLTSAFFRGTCAVFLVYSVNNRKSFDKLNQWLDKFLEDGSEEALVFLIGNKVDLQRAVSKEEGFQMMKKCKGIYWIETSAMTGQNITQLFSRAAETMLKKYYTSNQYRELVRPKTNYPGNSFIEDEERSFEKSQGPKNYNSFLLSGNSNGKDQSIALPNKKRRCCR